MITILEIVIRYFYFEWPHISILCTVEHGFILTVIKQLGAKVKLFGKSLPQRFSQSPVAAKLQKKKKTSSGTFAFRRWKRLITLERLAKPIQP